jgi:hypothetical protein
VETLQYTLLIISSLNQEVKRRIEKLANRKNINLNEISPLSRFLFDVNLGFSFRKSFFKVIINRLDFFQEAIKRNNSMEKGDSKEKHSKKKLMNGHLKNKQL